ncbi:MAG: hypothetical protein A3C30_01035 [Candidatus Levybacteria bacterium RIFCSPHIGHO2_02_FULL_40_18]|nr:MAG: hypothetical protein A3C30_01035 [Candidatus Levybacteria bacterium RIFCSPHIGHO2_02_FULL_40_18]OGH48969.1 MAG: hypothetical protein A3I54_02970 [Candidatus Levybacteria bacterium RIFCSPLOWO2_02_FULL_41_11]OGH53710.1 MAG: hypothetical protein A3G15_03260 [Candidatus Levybacteria bacterium RIFCSPLOWO2_12_FULL_40_10]
MKIIVSIVLVFTFFILARQSDAIYDSSTRSNNISGIHILFTYEIPKAAELVNSSGGDWGYVTIPIQYGDRDLEKWQKFMDESRRHHVIPIIRVATEPFYKNTSVWRKPNDFDIVDFANFLNSVSWPTKNRYVLLFNEVNRFDEWGGEPPAPSEYADFVSYAVDAFKARNQDFFIIAGGLDNASPNDGEKYLDNLVYLRRMHEHNPDVFKKIDGFSSHSYPNPNFSQAPSQGKIEGTSTYKFEVDLVERLSGRALPVFITETGWNADVLSDGVVSEYFKIAMNNWKQDVRVVAVTPFILESNGGPFDKFTFLKNGKFTNYGLSYQQLPKTKGDPVINPSKIIATNVAKPKAMPRVNFIAASFLPELSFDSKILKNYFKMILGIK